MPAHRDLIVEQFTKQAVPFSTAPGVRDEEALRLLVDFTGAGPEGTVLDVACGPGLVGCAPAAGGRPASGAGGAPAVDARARTLAELRALFGEVGLPPPRAAFYQLRSELEGLLERSFPEPGDAERVRRMIIDSLDGDGLGLGTQRRGDTIVFAYPVTALVATAR